MYHIEHTHKLLFKLNEPNMLCLLPSTWRYMSKAGTCFLLRNAAAALTVTTRHVLKVQVSYRTIIVLIRYANNNNIRRSQSSMTFAENGGPPLGHVAEYITYACFSFGFFFPRVVGRALRIASPKRSPLFFLWRLCVLVSLSLPLTSVLSFQKQKSHTSKSKEKKKDQIIWKRTFYWILERPKL